jgi:hypothetical protein
MKKVFIFISELNNTVGASVIVVELINLKDKGIKNYLVFYELCFNGFCHCNKRVAYNGRKTRVNSIVLSPEITDTVEKL